MKSDKNFLLTKTIITVGPAVASSSKIAALIRAGADVFRINFSHGDPEEHLEMLHYIREAEQETNTHIAVLGDLSGPKIRTGKVEEPGIMLVNGEKVIFRAGNFVASREQGTPVFSCTYPTFVTEINAGEKILLDDGNVELRCIASFEDDKGAGLECTVLRGGLITSAKGINLPDTQLSVPALTEKDMKCVEFAVKHDFDYLALSFVRSGEDLKPLKDKLMFMGARPAGDLPGYSSRISSAPAEAYEERVIPVIAKIEKPQALDNLAGIISEADAIMVARGDLGVEMDLAEVAVNQKKIIRMCHDYGKPVIVATQMLQSMIESQVPTRAEVSDVANAVFDGADAVMLSGETSVGKWPEESVLMLNRIVDRSGAYLRTLPSDLRLPKYLASPGLSSIAIAHSVKSVVLDIDVKYILVWSHSGSLAYFLSQLRIPKPVLTFSNSHEKLRRAAMMYGLQPVFMERPRSSREFVENADALLISNGWAGSGEPVVVVFDEPFSAHGISNLLSVHFIGQYSNARK